MRNKCYVHVFYVEDEGNYMWCFCTDKTAMAKDAPAKKCPICGKEIEIQTTELCPKVRTVRQIYSKYLDRWLNVEPLGEGL